MAKPAMFFHMLKNRAGEKAFGEALKRLAQEQRFQDKLVAGFGKDFFKRRPGRISVVFLHFG